MDEKYVWSITHQISAALQYCHFFGWFNGEGAQTIHEENQTVILHRDIKPGNRKLTSIPWFLILLFSSRSRTACDAVKLADFGLSIVIHGKTEPASYVGTRVYTAPEISSELETIRWTRECDISSFGLTIYELCTLDRPFAYRRVSPKETVPHLGPHYSKALNDLLHACVLFQPDMRPDAVYIHDHSALQISMRDPFDRIQKALREVIEKNSDFQENIRQGCYGTGLQALAQHGDLFEYLVESERIRYISTELSGRERFYEESTTYPRPFDMNIFGIDKSHAQPDASTSHRLSALKELVLNLEENIKACETVYSFALFKYNSATSTMMGTSLASTNSDCATPSLLDQIQTQKDNLLELQEQAMALLAKTLQTYVGMIKQVATWTRESYSDPDVDEVESIGHNSISGRLTEGILFILGRFFDILEYGLLIRIQRTDTMQGRPVDDATLKSTRPPARGDHKMAFWMNHTTTWMNLLLKGEDYEPPSYLYSDDNFETEFYSWFDFEPIFNIAAERILYDQAIEISRNAAIQELPGQLEDLPDTLNSYRVSVKMLESISFDSEDDGVMDKEVRSRIKYRIDRVTAKINSAKHQSGLQQRSQEFRKGIEVCDDINLSPLLDKISRWRTNPRFDGHESLGEDGEQQLRKSAQALESWRRVLSKTIPVPILRRRLARARWRTLSLALLSCVR
ncbi:hypothetical protein ACMFMG_002450 [Clarireedia jacksonii]